MNCNICINSSLTILSMLSNQIRQNRRMYKKSYIKFSFILNYILNNVIYIYIHFLVLKFWYLNIHGYILFCLKINVLVRLFFFFFSLIRFMSISIFHHSYFMFRRQQILHGMLSKQFNGRPMEVLPFLNSILTLLLHGRQTNMYFLILYKLTSIQFL